VVGPGSTPRIVGNRISGNTIGLTFMDGAAGSVVADNLISDNVYGVCAPNFGEARMAANRVSGNHLSDLLNPEAQIQTVSVQPASDPGVIQLASAQ
jgi:parallel beta-helix repeat protein